MVEGIYNLEARYFRNEAMKAYKVNREKELGRIAETHEGSLKHVYKEIKKKAENGEYEIVFNISELRDDVVKFLSLLDFRVRKDFDEKTLTIKW